MRTRSLLAAPAAAALLLGGLAGVAAAQDTGPDSPECSAVQQQLAALEADLAAAIEADNAAGAAEDSQAVATLKSQVQATIGLVDDRCAPVEPDPTTEPTPTTEPPADTDPPYESCAEAIEAGAIMPAVRGINDSYQADLDADGDGVACEADEDTSTPPAGGTGGGSGSDSDSSTGGSGGSFDFSQLDDVPSRAAETGGGPA